MRHFIRSIGALAAACVLGLLTGACASRGTEMAGDNSVPHIDVLTLNIWHDREDWPARSEVLLAEMEALSPDIVGLQEVIQREELRNQASTIADVLGHFLLFTSTDGPESPKRYGNAILTRFPIVETNRRLLAPLNDYRTAGHALVDADGVLLDVYVTHLHHTGQGAAIREEQIADLLDFIDETRGGEAAILMGDFNAAPGWPELGAVHERFVDTFALFVTDPLDARYTTLNVSEGHSGRRIDYVFLSKDSADVLTPVSSDIVFDVPNAEGVWPSDHYGVITRFAVNGPGGAP